MYVKRKIINFLLKEIQSRYRYTKQWTKYHSLLLNLSLVSRLFHSIVSYATTHMKCKDHPTFLLQHLKRQSLWSVWRGLKTIDWQCILSKEDLEIINRASIKITSCYLNKHSIQELSPKDVTDPHYKSDIEKISYRQSSSKHRHWEDIVLLKNSLKQLRLTLRNRSDYLPFITSLRQMSHLTKLELFNRHPYEFYSIQFFDSIKDLKELQHLTIGTNLTDRKTISGSDCKYSYIPALIEYLSSLQQNNSTSAASLKTLIITDMISPGKYLYQLLTFLLTSPSSTITNLGINLYRRINIPIINKFDKLTYHYHVPSSKDELLDYDEDYNNMLGNIDYDTIFKSFSNVKHLKWIRPHSSAQDDNLFKILKLCPSIRHLTIMVTLPSPKQDFCDALLANNTLCLFNIIVEYCEDNTYVYGPFSPRTCIDLRQIHDTILKHTSIRNKAKFIKRKGDPSLRPLIRLLKENELQNYLK